MDANFFSHEDHGDVNDFKVAPVAVALSPRPITTPGGSTIYPPLANSAIWIIRNPKFAGRNHAFSEFEARKAAQWMERL